jgi:hypothetical protein
MTLIKKGLYNRGDDMMRSIPEERAMRYASVCTSMVAN